MPSKHKAPLLGWHAPLELAEWVRGEAARRGVPLSTILNEAIAVRRIMPSLIASLRTMDSGGRPVAPDDVLDELLDAAYVKGLDDAQ
jgi:hypothetical protein